MNNILNVLAIGPTVWLLLASVVATVAVALGTTGKLVSFAASIEESANNLANSFGYSCLRGAAALALLLFVALPICYRHPPFKLLGILLLSAAVIWTAVGAIIACQFVGAKMVSSGLRFRFHYDEPIIGFTLLAASSVLPVVGWVTVLIMITAGAGAFLSSTLSNARSEHNQATEP